MNCRCGAAASILLIVGVCLLAGTGARAQIIPAPNSNPSFTRGPDITVSEDSGQYADTWAKDITDNDGDRQSLRFTVVAANTQLFKTQPKMNDQGRLTFEPGADQYGATLVTATLVDDGTSQCVVGGNITECPAGCQPTDCRNSKTSTFTITITAVNDCPKLQIRGDVTVNEDAGSVTQTGWAYQVTRGPQTLSNEDTQTLKWMMTNDNPSLFKQPPKVIWTGSSGSTANLHFETEPHAFGTAKVTLRVQDNGGTADGGCDQSEVTTFSIKLTAVNDAPTYTFGTNPIEVGEDSGTYTKAAWATSIDVGAPSEASQQVSFTLQAVNTATSDLFDVQPAIDASGTLTFTLKDNRNTLVSSAYFYVQLSDDHTPQPGTSCSPITSCPRLRIIINAVNDVPSFTLGKDVTVHEDLLQLASPPSPAMYSVANWAKDISPGNTIEKSVESQGVEFLVSATVTSLFSVQPAVDASGTLSFTLSPHKNGATSVFVRIRDTGANTAAQGHQHQFSITVLPVNDAPLFTFVMTSPHSLAMNAGSQIFQNFITTAQAGPDVANDELASQTLSWSVVATPTSLFSVAPVVSFTSSNTAKVSFVVADGQVGEGKLSVTLKDNGGTARSGSDQLTSVFRFNVATTNTAPSFSLAGSELRVDEDAYVSSQYSAANWAGSILPGTAGAVGQREALTQTVAFTLVADNTALFQVQPAISSTGTLTFTANSNAFGSSTVTVTATDDSTPKLSSAAQTFTIRIIPVNDAPYFRKGSDVSVPECRSSESSPCTHSFSAWASSVTSAGAGGLTNEAGQKLTFTVTPASATGSSSLTNILTSAMAVDSTTGTLSFSLKPGGGNTVSGAVTMNVVLSDDGGITSGGVDRFTAAFSFTVTPYVAPPSFAFSASSDLTVLEDSGVRTLTDVVVSIAPGQGPATAGASVSTILSFGVESAESALFTGTPSVLFTSETTASLRLQPAPNAYGSTTLTITLRNSRSGLSSVQYKKVHITGINDAPTFTLATTEVLLQQGAGAQTVSLATGISAGAGKETNDQTVSFTITCYTSNSSVGTSSSGAVVASYFSIPPTLEASGKLFFSPSAAAVGTVYCGVSLKDDAGTANNGRDTSTGVAYFSIKITPLNHAPSFTKKTDVVSMYEDQEPFTTISGWALDISTGEASVPAGSLAQKLVFEVVCTVNQSPVADYNSTTAFFSQQPLVDASSGDLLFAVKPNVNGVVRCEVSVVDDGSNTAPNQNRSPSQSLLIYVLAVNDAPEFALKPGGSSIVRYQGDASAMEVAGWAVNIKAGPVDEAEQQTTSFTTSMDSTVAPGQGATSLLSLPAVVTDTGTLKLWFNPETSGIGVLKVCLSDDGGIAGPPTPIESRGLNISCLSVRVTVIAVNQNPVVGLSSTVIQVFEDEGIHNSGGTLVIPSFVNKLLAGSSSGEQSTQTLHSASVSCPCSSEVAPSTPLPSVLAFLFVKAPKVVLRTTTTGSVVGDIHLTLKSDSNGFCGGCTLSVVDSAGSNTTSSTFSIRVLPVNDAPTFSLPALPASSVAGGAISSTFSSRVDVFDQRNTLLTFPTWAKDVSVGPPDEQTTQTSSFSLVSLSSTSQLTNYFSQPPTLSSNGTLSFSFSSVPSPASVVAASPFSFSVTLKDSGGTQFGGVDTTNGVVVGTTTVSIILRIHVSSQEGDINSKFTKGHDVTVLEDSGFATIRSWATILDSSLSGNTFQVTATDPLLFNPQPSVVFPSGDLLFAPAPNRFGTTTVFVGLLPPSGGLANSTGATGVVFSITIVPVNDAPIFTSTTLTSSMLAVSDGGILTLTLLEDSSLVASDAGGSAVKLAASISPGAFETNQTVHVSLLLPSSDPAASPSPVFSTALLNSNNIQLNSSGTISFLLLNKNSFGAMAFLISVKDDGGVANGGKDESVHVPIRLVVKAVNDAPELELAATHLQITGDGTSLLLSFDDGGTIVTTPGSPSSGGTTFVLVKGMIKHLSVGPLNERGNQQLQPAVPTVSCQEASSSSGGSALSSAFVAGPSITNLHTSVDDHSMTADVSFTLRQGALGSVVCNVTAHDSGGTSDGGVDTISKVFTIAVSPMNVAPSFSLAVDILEVPLATAITIPNFIVALSPGSTPEHLTQNITSVLVTLPSLRQHLFAIQPSVTISSGTESLRQQTGSLSLKSGAVSGSVNITLVAIDSAGGRSLPVFCRVVVVAALPSTPVTLVKGGILLQVTLSTLSQNRLFSRDRYIQDLLHLVRSTPSLAALLVSGPLSTSEVIVAALWDVAADRRQSNASSPFVLSYHFQANPSSIIGAEARRQTELDDLATALHVHLTTSPSFVDSFSRTVGYTVLASTKEEQRPQSGEERSGGSFNDTIVIVILVVGLLLVVLCIVAAVCFVVRRKRDDAASEKAGSKKGKQVGAPFDDIAEDSLSSSSNPGVCDGPRTAPGTRSRHPHHAVDMGTGNSVGRMWEGSPATQWSAVPSHYGVEEVQSQPRQEEAGATVRTHHVFTEKDGRSGFTSHGGSELSSVHD